MLRFEPRVVYVLWLVCVATAVLACLSSVATGDGSIVGMLVMVSNCSVMFSSARAFSSASSSSCNTKKEEEEEVAKHIF